jgi:hypothetical protein
VQTRFRRDSPQGPSVLPQPPDRLLRRLEPMRPIGADFPLLGSPPRSFALPQLRPARRVFAFCPVEFGEVGIVALPAVAVGLAPAVAAELRLGGVRAAGGTPNPAGPDPDAADGRLLAP